MIADIRNPAMPPHASTTYTDLTRIFGRIGLLSFGGPAAQIALMHRELVEARPWLTEQQFLRALSFCMLLPGPEAMQLATYAGWRLRGVAGGLIAGGLFVLPGALLIFGLALAYAGFGDLPWVQTVFLGIKAVIVVIVLDALLKLAKRALLRPTHWVIAALAFIGIYTLNMPFPLILLLAGIAGSFGVTKAPPARPRPLGIGQCALTVLIWGALWLIPLLAVMLAFPDFLGPLALFFSKLAVVTFGGAYAVLAYMTQAVIGDFGWLSTAQMMDALGLAETTPGPLILVTQFVGILAGYGEGGIAMAVMAGLVTLWMTFVPCFLWIFAGAPFIDRLSDQPRLSAALQAVTAAVVGVIVNLSLWFAIHVFFDHQALVTLGPARVLIPDPASLNLLPAMIACSAGYLLLIRKMALPGILALAAGLSFVAHNL